MRGKRLFYSNSLTPSKNTADRSNKPLIKKQWPKMSYHFTTVNQSILMKGSIKISQLPIILPQILFCSHVVVSYSTHAHFCYIHQNMPFKKLFSWQILQQSHTCSAKTLHGLPQIHQHMSFKGTFWKKQLDIFTLVKHSHVLSNPFIILHVKAAIQQISLTTPTKHF